MIITKEFLDNVGRRSPIARAVMIQAGDKHRIKALKDFLISIGACEITYKEAESLGLKVYEKKYSFSAVILTYVLLNDNDFARFKPLQNRVTLEAVHIRNGLIGIRKRETND